MAAVEIEEELNWGNDAREEAAKYFRPSEPYLPSKEEWNHNPNAEIVPWWVMPVLVTVILGLTILTVKFQSLAPLFK